MSEKSSITLYSGGHKGAEAEFGRMAEKWGLGEVNYSFDGHAIERTRGVSMLGPDELDKGNVSMEIVSARMGRKYAQAEKIRKVIQSIFHMVNRGYHVLAIGWIQPDGTVKGGTGWAVELAKLFNRPINVYDQQHRSWFAWKGNQWIEEVPKITDDTFVGTGTRHLSEDGRKAIADLYEWSFGEV